MTLKGDCLYKCIEYGRILNMTKFSYGVVSFLCLVILATGAQSANAATTYYYNNDAKIAELYAIIAQLQLQLQTLLANGNYTHGGYQGGDVRVVTGGVDESSIDNAVELSGTVDFRNEDEARVWFEYGLTQALSYSTPSILLKERHNDEDFTIIADDIDGNRTYYYRAVAEDEDGDVSEGAVRSFTVKGNWDNDRDDDDDMPSVTTDDAENITDYSARLTGAVDMNDAEDGVVFFVYGEDEDMVEDVIDENTYGDIDTDGDDLQKVRIDSRFEGDDDFSYTVSGLDNDTEYFFRLCVQYEDEDDDETLECGRVESFETDRY